MALFSFFLQYGKQYQNIICKMENTNTPAPTLLILSYPLPHCIIHKLRRSGVHKLPHGDFSALALDLKSPPSPTPEPRLQAHSGVGVGGCSQHVLNSNAAGLEVALENPVMGRRVGMMVQHPPTLMTNASRWESKSSELARTDRATFKPNQPSEGSGVTTALPSPKRAPF